MTQALFLAWLPFAITLAISAMVLGAGHYVLLARVKNLGSEARLPRQLLLLILTISAVLMLIVVSPLPESVRTQILTLIGVLLSGVIALSSAPFVTNFMAAVMLRVTRPFSVGDFIQVGEFFGKVSERGLFDTEIQTENRELIAIPNSAFINQGVTVLRSSGVIVSANISLGYDLGYTQVEELTLQAAADIGLSEPFLHIIELGDFAVEYRVAGLLTDAEKILTTRSALRRQILYVLHGAGLEIVSPTITRHITQSEETRILPPEQPQPAPASERGAEDIVFDKAKEVEQLVQQRSALKEELQALQESGDNSEKASQLQEQLATMKTQLKELNDEKRSS